MIERCNILIIGKTGVGKSALINYLAGKRIAESGIASSSGGITKGISRYAIEIAGHDCMVADSEGLESGDYDRWKKIIQDEMEKSSSKKSLSDWYHIVIFCISAGGYRVEESEIKYIEQLTRDGYGVIVAFTKADQSSEEDTEKLRHDISAGIANSTALEYVDVCSVKSRSCDKFGDKELANVISKQWRRTLVNRLPEHIYDWAVDSLASRKRAIKDYVWEQDMGILGRSVESVSGNVNQKTKDAVERLSSEMEERYEAAVDDINAVTGIFDAILPISSQSSGLGSFAGAVQVDISSGKLLVGGLLAVGAVGTLLGIGIAPIVIPFAILKAVFNDGSKKKRKICDAIDDTFYPIRKRLLSQKEEFQKRLAESYGGM